MSLSPPPTTGKTNAPWAAWFQQLWTLVVALGGNGATAARPLKNLYVGLQYFDTTLGKPVFVQSLGPTVWVDATGAVV